MKRLRQDRPQGERQAAHPLRVVALPLLLVIALVAIAVAGWWLKRPAEAMAVACANPLAGCSFSHRGAPVSARFSMQPVPLEAFELTVTATDVAKISAEFQMVGMDMGFNRYDLRATPDGTFASKVTLPICISGRHDWVLTLELDGSRYALPFSSR